MQRPIRTSWMSIAAMVSFAAFAVLTVFAVRSFWTWDLLSDGVSEMITLSDGCVMYTHTSTSGASRTSLNGHISGRGYPNLRSIRRAILGFSATRSILPSGVGQLQVSQVTLPLWPLLLLLIVMPVLWLIARPPAGPAFTVLTEVGRKIE